MAENPSILIADDDRFVRTLLRDILEEAGCRLSEATNGLEALEKLRSERPDLVLLDLFMPGASGLEVLGQVSRLSPGTQVLVISSMDAESMIEHALQAGACGFIAKPFHPLEIAAAVNAALAEKGA